jgi:naphthoate synthase
MDWITVKEYEDITYKKCNGVARIAFNRPDVRCVQNDIRTIQCIYDAQEDTSIGVLFCLLKVLHQKMESTLL